MEISPELLYQVMKRIEDERKQRLIRLMSQGLCDISDPSMQIDLLDLMPSNIEILDVTGELSGQQLSDVRGSTRPFISLEPLFVSGRAYKMRPRTTTAQVSQISNISTTPQDASGAGGVDLGTTGITRVGKYNYKKFLAAYIIFWDNTTRTSKNTILNKTVTIKKAYNSGATIFDFVLDVQTSTASDWYLTRPLNKADEAWAGPNEDWVVNVQSVALYVDVVMIVELR